MAGKGKPAPTGRFSDGLPPWLRLRTASGGSHLMTSWRIILGLAAGALPVLASEGGFQQAALASYELADVGGTVVVRAVEGPGPGADRYFVFFQFEGVLWCYAPEAGTWIFGPAPAHWPPSDQEALAWVESTGPSLRRVRFYRDLPEPAARESGLPHGCVVACLAQLSNLLIHTGPPEEVGLVLLSYDGERGPGEALGPRLIGHSLLVYRYAGKWYCFDPRWDTTATPLGQVAVGAPLDETLRALAQRPDCRLTRARLLRISHHTLDQVDTSVTWRLLKDRRE